MGANIFKINPAAFALTIGVIGTMHVIPKIHPKIPSALVAVGGATATTKLLGLSATSIGALPSGLSAFTLSMPTLPPIESLPALGGTLLLHCTPRRASSSALPEALPTLS